MELKVNTKTVRQSVAMIIPVNGKVVAIRSKKYNNRATLPGGKVETGECLEKAAIRETMEETGVILTSDEIQAFYSAPICSDVMSDNRAYYISTCYRALMKNNLDLSLLKDSDEGQVFLASWEELLKGPFGEFYTNMLEYYLKLT